MSDYHILRQDEKDKGWQIAFHFPVKAGSNEGKRSWQAVMKEKNSANLQSVVPNIDSLEQGSINNGLVIEHVDFFRFSKTGLTFAEKKNEVTAAWNNIKLSQEQEAAQTLNFWGVGVDRV